MNKAYRYGKILVLAGALFSASSCEQANEKETFILDIPAIANKTPEQVISILGQPDSSYFQKRGQKRVPVQLYKPHKIEVFYPAGKASEIVVNEPAPLPYHERSLASFNIEPQSPNQANDNAAIKWSNIRGFKHITFFSHDIQSDTVSAFRMFFNLEEAPQQP